MKILVVEDDYMQAQWVCSELANHFGTESIRLINNEREFRELLPRLTANPPDIVIMDVMLPWTSASSEFVEPPDEVKESGPLWAGLRCRELLRNDAHTTQVPVIMYTVLERSSLPEDVIYVSKHTAPRQLFDTIRSMLR